ncbi:MAG: hypothetical protein IJY27_00970 [Clostridia bacterium]|nr:hypothetical protein [Clostridia bacterium]
MEQSAHYLTDFSAHLYRFPHPPTLFDTKPGQLGDGKWSIYGFSEPTDYTGVLSVGKDFDLKFWPENEYTERVPFCPEVYRQNGYIKIENGRVVEKLLIPRTAK